MHKSYSRQIRNAVLAVTVCGITACASLVPGGAPDSTDTPKRPVAGMGKLTLQTTPWTEVFLGTKSLGESPLIEVPLPAGKHTLKLVNAEANIKMSVEVEIAAGKTTVKKLKF